MKDAIKQVVDGKNLALDQARRVMNIMLSGQATQAQIGAFLTALRLKGETLEEIVGCASVLKEKAEHIHPKIESYVDLVGTGGDSTFSFNISTTAAFVVAGAGLAVAKHGNRSISSKSGAADVLEALGVNITSNPKQVERAVEEIGIGFMFAQTFNKSMKYVGQARNEMGIRTIFNILGPLANPSGATHQVIGVFEPKLTLIFAKAMKQLGVTNAMIVNAKDGMDEISTVSETVVAEIKDGVITQYEIRPEQYGLKRVTLQQLRGGDANYNAEITKSILEGKKGAQREVVLLNAAATLYVGKKVKTIEEGLHMAEESIDSKRALEKLHALCEFTNKE